MLITALDTEALSLRPTAVVWEIAWLTADVGPDFHVRGGRCRRYHCMLRVDKQRQRGRLEDPDTIRFTIEQHGPDAMDLVNSGTVEVEDALTLLRDCCELSSEVWCNGASFDFPLLKSLADDFLQRVPVPFGRECCLRGARNAVFDRKVSSAANSSAAHRAPADVEWVLETLQRIRPGFEARRLGIHHDRFFSDENLELFNRLPATC